LTNFLIFLKADVFGKNGKNNAFLGFMVKRLEIKLRVQQGMTFLNVTFTCNLAAKTLIFLGQKKRIQILVKNNVILGGFSSVVYPN